MRSNKASFLQWVPVEKAKQVMTHKIIFFGAEKISSFLRRKFWKSTSEQIWEVSSKISWIFFRFQFVCIATLIDKSVCPVNVTESCFCVCCCCCCCVPALSQNSSPLDENCQKNKELLWQICACQFQYWKQSLDSNDTFLEQLMIFESCFRFETKTTFFLYLLHHRHN